MATVSFDADVSVADLVDAAVRTFDFTLPGRGGETLGRDLAVRAALGIQQRSADGEDPDGNPWKPNEEKYAKYKHDRYQVDRPGELGGQMLSLTSLLGKPEVTAENVLMVYGWNTPPPADARNGVPLTPSERKATDREKGSYFTDGGRRFYELDDATCESMVAVAAAALETHLREAFP